MSRLPEVALLYYPIYADVSAQFWQLLAHDHYDSSL